MTQKPNFFKLGIFIIAAVILIVAGIILFGSGVFAKDKSYFETYFTDSVQGLSKGSSVQISGVEIGTVEEISFVTKTYHLPLDENQVSEYDKYVRVVCSSIEEDLPRAGSEKESHKRWVANVKRGIRLRLASNIITGQAYLQATLLDPNRFPAPEIPWEPQYFYIPSAPSSFTTIKDSVDEIIQELKKVRVKEITDNLNTLIENLNKTVTNADIKGVSRKIQKLITTGEHAINDANLAALSDNFNTFIEELKQSNQGLKELLANPESENGKTFDNIPALLEKMGQTLTRFDQMIMRQTPEAQEIMENIRHLSENINYLTERLKDNPSNLIFSSPPPKTGVIK
jgi:phospholipid/cholesterol/gamma-HCH transport system substrate-binding protein/paraquat-inducible protein B